MTKTYIFLYVRTPTDWKDMSTWWFAIVVYAVIAIIVAVLFARDAAKAEYYKPGDDNSVAVLLGILWPITCIMLLNMWRQDRCHKKPVLHKQG